MLACGCERGQLTDDGGVDFTCQSIQSRHDGNIQSPTSITGTIDVFRVQQGLVVVEPFEDGSVIVLWGSR